jgi:hypothetical protein
MTNFEIIELKLKRFISKYYRNALLRGVILFMAFGLLYFLFTVVIEYFLWLNPVGRAILFGLFILIESFLLIRFVGIPLARLLQLSRGINFRDASSMIGIHFPEVSDKLINVLQLHKSGGDDELTWASINQKSEHLKPIPFTLAIDYKRNKKFLPYLAIPLVIIAGLLFTGNNKVLTDSAKRVADFNNEYRPPAPFNFTILNSDINTLQRRDFKLNIAVDGRKLPENASINFDGQTYFLTQESAGKFSFIFKKPMASIEFYLSANQVKSHVFLLNVKDVPILNGFELFLDYPTHTGKQDDTMVSTGNAVVPQGTNITWKLNTSKTSYVDFITSDNKIAFQKFNSHFAFAKAVLQPIKYAISISNENIKDYESLHFKIEVVKDEYPELDLKMKRDSIVAEVKHFKGQVSDDYGISKIQLVYYTTNDASEAKRYGLGSHRGTFDQFLFTFPGNLPLKAGNSYEYYFEVTDNDEVNDYKVTKSKVFTYRKLANDELEDQQLAKQKESVSNLEEALKEQEKQQEKLDEISKEQLQKKDRSFNDKRKLKQALRNQQKQEQKMRQELEKMKDNFQKSSPQKDPMKELLENRMQKSAEELKKNEELLKELQEYQDKLQPEELKEKMDKAKSNSKKQKRNLEQLLELTKRFYVQQKFEQLGKELEKIAVKQKKQSEKNGVDNTKEEQDKLNEEYKDWEKELNQLEDENDGLKDPTSLEFEPEDSKEIKQEQKQSSNDLEKAKTPQAQKKQKSAAEKMQKQAASMSAQMSAMSQEAMKEDTASLRQILDNLIVFSKEEEELMESTKEMTRLSSNLGKKLKLQKELELAFEHVDDSLFALATRNPKIGQEINKEVTDVYYYLEKSLEQIAEFEMKQGQVSQQFVFKGANTLANMLSNTLDAMNNSIPIPGMGKDGESGQGFQLPNIIKKQESLAKSGEGKKLGNKGEEGKEGDAGESGKGGESGEGGESGTLGESGEGEGKGEGKSGKNGESGSDGESGADGKDGESPGYRESEEEAKRIYGIYKKQQELRGELEDMIRREGLEEKVGGIIDKMKAVERKLLDQGFNREVQQRMMDIQQDLLKLKDAGLEQGEENQREARTNRRDFYNTTDAKTLDAAKYFNNKEILNRQVLPLQPQYRTKVKEYFKAND